MSQYSSPFDFHVACCTAVYTNGSDTLPPSAILIRFPERYGLHCEFIDHSSGLGRVQWLDGPGVWGRAYRPVPGLER